MTTQNAQLPMLKKAEGPWQRRLRVLRRNRMAMIGLAIILFWAVAALVAPMTGMRDPLKQEIADRLQPPSAEYWFGTDELGRDVFSRVIYGRADFIAHWLCGDCLCLAGRLLDRRNRRVLRWGL